MWAEGKYSLVPRLSANLLVSLVCDFTGTHWFLFYFFTLWDRTKLDISLLPGQLGSDKVLVGLSQFLHRADYVQKNRIIWHIVK